MSRTAKIKFVSLLALVVISGGAFTPQREDILVGETFEVAPEQVGVFTEGDAPLASVVVAPVLSRAEKLAARIAVLATRIESDTVAIAEARTELETSERLAGVAAGTKIVARIGRADTAKNVEATVVHVKDDESGSRRLKITYGEGADFDVAVIQESQIVEVVVA